MSQDEDTKKLVLSAVYSFLASWLLTVTTYIYIYNLTINSIVENKYLIYKHNKRLQEDNYITHTH